MLLVNASECREGNVVCCVRTEPYYFYLLCFVKSLNSICAFGRLISKGSVERVEDPQKGDRLDLSYPSSILEVGTGKFVSGSLSLREGGSLLTWSDYLGRGDEKSNNLV